MASSTRVAIKQAKAVESVQKEVAELGQQIAQLVQKVESLESLLIAQTGKKPPAQPKPTTKRVSAKK